MNALGLIETVGLAAAIEAADAAVKSANVTLLSYELTKGGGMVMIKFVGDVGAVKAALEAGSAAAARVGKVASKHMIARPHDEIEKIIYTKETVGPLKRTTETDETKTDVPSSQPEIPESTETHTKVEGTEGESTIASVSDNPSAAGESLENKAVSKEEEIQQNQAAGNESEQSPLTEAAVHNDTEDATPVEQENPDFPDEEGNLFEESAEVDSSQLENGATCNICKDPKCPRKKGDLRSTCIHYKEIRRNGK